MSTCFDHGLDGRKTDACVKAIAVNSLKPERPTMPVELQSRSELLHMMKSADDTHMFIDGDTTYINALYAVAENFPAPRIYFIKTRDVFEASNIWAYLKGEGISLPPVKGEKFEALIDAPCYLKRYQEWLARWKAKTEAFSGLVEGRIQNTAVDKGMWISSDNRCLICGTSTNLVSIATLLGSKGLMIGLQLCSIHEAEAKNQHLMLDYIAKKFGIASALATYSKEPLEGAKKIEQTCASIRKNLDCEIEKVLNQTITAVRKSGFRIILRQDSLTDYAYNFQDPNGVLISRIDSADHHRVAYGPDHVHKNLSKKKKNQVDPSFTFGLALADLKAIKTLIEAAETQWAEAKPK